jgi:hypothetical protein
VGSHFIYTTATGIVSIPNSATGVNSLGDYVGVSTVPIAVIGGTTYQLNSLAPGYNFQGANGINDIGQIIAVDSDSLGYLLTPVADTSAPEPCTLLLAAVGGIAFAIARKRRVSRRAICWSVSGVDEAEALLARVEEGRLITQPRATGREDYRFRVAG